MRCPWVDDTPVALFTDLYELTMVQAYLAEEMHDEAVFSLFVHRFPARQNYLVACGLETVLQYPKQLRFSAESVEYLASLRRRCWPLESRCGSWT